MQQEIKRIAFAALLAAGLGSASAEMFEGQSFTVSLMPIGTVSILPSDLAAPEYQDSYGATEPRYAFDQLYSGGIMAELCLSYNFSRYYVGLSGFGAACLRAEGEYYVSDYTDGGRMSDYLPLELQQYLAGAGAEIGFCRGTTNYYGGGSSDSKAYHHWGIAVGPYVLFSESNVSALSKASIGIYGKMRFQILLGGNWGLEAMVHVGGIASAGLGGFLKLP